MNTARQSALRIRLNPKGKYLLTVIMLPDLTRGSIFREKINGARIKTSASRFLSRSEILPAKGSINAPARGTKTADNKRVSLLMNKINP
jgi:hypothetical protein